MNTTTASLNTSHAAHTNRLFCGLHMFFGVFVETTQQPLQSTLIVCHDFYPHKRPQQTKKRNRQWGNHRWRIVSCWWVFCVVSRVYRVVFGARFQKWVIYVIALDAKIWCIIRWRRINASGSSQVNRTIQF